MRKCICSFHTMEYCGCQDKMKILRIITRLNIGGPSIQALDLDRELNKRGHDTLLLSGMVDRNNREKRMVDSRSLHIPGLRREIFKSKYRINWRDDLKALEFIRMYIKHFNPDIVHSHQAKAGALAVLACLTIPKSKRPKIVHTYHGHTFHSYWSKPKAFLFRNIERILNRFRDKVIAISETQVNELVCKYKVVNPSKVKLIRLGFDLSSLLNMTPFDNDQRKGLGVGIIGRLTDIKNHELFFEFITELKKAYPGVVFPYIIGDGERRECLDSIKPSLMLFKGWLSRAELINYYSKLDIVVCTSKNEGTPVSLIEAMAAGRLVVSTPVGGCRDLLGSRIDGNIAERGVYLPSSGLQIAPVLDVINSGQYKDIVENARRYVKKHYSLDNLLNNIEKLYEEL